MLERHSHRPCLRFNVTRPISGCHPVGPNSLAATTFYEGFMSY